MRWLPQPVPPAAPRAVVVAAHGAILASIDLALVRCEEDSVCAKGGCCAPGLVDADAVAHILSEMQRHSDVYDAAYAGKLGAADGAQLDSHVDKRRKA